MAYEELEKNKKIRGGYKGYVTTTLEKLQTLLDNFELSGKSSENVSDHSKILGTLDDEIVNFFTEEHIAKCPIFLPADGCLTARIIHDRGNKINK